MSWSILHGDVRDRLRTLVDASIDAIVTDPPYELSFMGKAWDASGIAFTVEMWREALRVLKPGGHLLAFGGARTYHRMVVAIEDSGFEIRDQIMWVYGSGFPKSRNLHGLWDGWGTALKPAHEPIVVARKPLIGTVAANVLEHGTGALNINATRIPTADILSGSGTPPLRYAGENSRPFHETAEARGCNQHALGRWPANLIHDGSDEVLEVFPQTTSGGQLLTTHNAKESDNGSMAGKNYEGRIKRDFGRDTGSAARFFYCAKASRSERGQDNKHPTVKPLALMQYLCRLVTPPDGIVLDPFAGSGTTGIAAAREGFGFIGIDSDPAHVELGHNRIYDDAPLFNGTAVQP